MKRAAVAVLFPMLAACASGGAEATAPAAVEPVTMRPVLQPPPAEQPRPEVFAFDGQLTQGGWIRGRAPWRATRVTLGGAAIQLDRDGYFFAAFDRDAPASMRISAVLADGRVIEAPVSVAPRAWQIERINAARRPGGATEEFLARRRPELARIAAARESDSGSGGWRQSFIWPVKGRISGRFGSQRIYRGEPGAYHTGLDIAPGAGVPYVAPADGVVVLAATDPFTLEGNLLIVDHGAGLNSAFLHSQSLAVREGDRVRQGQLLGYVGATGRATGPHLHWSLEWQGARLDPLLFLPSQ